VNSYARAKNIRINAVKMVSDGGSSHIGAVLSCVDILAVLYARVMRYDCLNPDWPNRDRFILSKGHAGVGVYATLAEFGFFAKEELAKHYTDGSYFSGHVSHKNIPGVEFSTGSLGHGLPVAAGIALSAKMDGTDIKSYVLTGDGELAEGSNWEAMLFASHHKLDNLVLVIDRNNLQSMTTTEKTIALEPLEEKLAAFNWQVCSVDGHDHDALESALKMSSNGHPLAVIANTTKGKGVSYMEGKVEWHYKFPNEGQLQEAISELEKGE
jgi:transketolase